MSANRSLGSMSRIAWRSAGSSARGWRRSRCGTGTGRGGAGLARCRRYQLACGTPAAAQAARVPIRGAMAAIASSVTDSTRPRCPRPRRSSPRAPAVLTGLPPRSGPWPAPAPAVGFFPQTADLRVLRISRRAALRPARLAQLASVPGPPPVDDVTGIQARPAQDRAFCPAPPRYRRPGRRVCTGR